MALCWLKSKKRNSVCEMKPSFTKQDCELCNEYFRLSCNGHKVQIYLEPKKENKTILRRDSNHQPSPSKQTYYTFKFLNSFTSKRTWMITPSLRATYLTLDLHKKKLQKIHENIHRFKDLKAICLSNNFKLTHLSGLGEITTLRLIIAKNCNIENLENALPSRLLALDLYNNPQLKEFKQIQNLKKLQHLNIGSCCIKRIPAEVSQLQQLIVLSLDDNLKLMRPITGLSSLIHLQVLLIRNCNLYQIPEEVYTLNELVFLSVEHNKISEVPAKIARMANLSVLSIYGNRGITVNGKVTRIPTLKRINVDPTFSTKLLSTALKKLIKIWKDSPSAWWKQL